MKDAPRYQIEFRHAHTGRQKFIDADLLPHEYDAAMETDDPELFMRAYVLKRLLQTEKRRLEDYRPVLPDGMTRITVN